ncbi:unnamed protein product, partial [Didymodactylos carnosus]
METKSEKNSNIYHTSLTDLIQSTRWPEISTYNEHRNIHPGSQQTHISHHHQQQQQSIHHDNQTNKDYFITLNDINQVLHNQAVTTTSYSVVTGAPPSITRPLNTQQDYGTNHGGIITQTPNIPHDQGKSSENFSKLRVRNETKLKTLGTLAALFNTSAAANIVLTNTIKQPTFVSLQQQQPVQSNNQHTSNINNDSQMLLQHLQNQQVMVQQQPLNQQNGTTTNVPRDGINTIDDLIHAIENGHKFLVRFGPHDVNSQDILQLMHSFKKRPRIFTGHLTTLIFGDLSYKIAQPLPEGHRLSSYDILNQEAVEALCSLVLTLYRSENLRRQQIRTWIRRKCSDSRVKAGTQVGGSNNNLVLQIQRQTSIAEQQQKQQELLKEQLHFGNSQQHQLLLNTDDENEEEDDEPMIINNDLTRTTSMISIDEQQQQTSRIIDVNEQLHKFFLLYDNNTKNVSFGPYNVVLGHIVQLLKRYAPSQPRVLTYKLSQLIFGWDLADKTPPFTTTRREASSKLDNKAFDTLARLITTMCPNSSLTHPKIARWVNERGRKLIYYRKKHKALGVDVNLPDLAINTKTSKLTTVIPDDKLQMTHSDKQQQRLIPSDDGQIKNLLSPINSPMTTYSPLYSPSPLTQTKKRTSTTKQTNKQQENQQQQNLSDIPTKLRRSSESHNENNSHSPHIQSQQYLPKPRSSITIDHEEDDQDSMMKELIDAIKSGQRFQVWFGSHNLDSTQILSVIEKRSRLSAREATHSLMALLFSDIQMSLMKAREAAANLSATSNTIKPSLQVTANPKELLNEAAILQISKLIRFVYEKQHIPLSRIVSWVHAFNRNGKRRPPKTDSTSKSSQYHIDAVVENDQQEQIRGLSIPLTTTVIDTTNEIITADLSPHQYYHESSLPVSSTAYNYPKQTWNQFFHSVDHDTDVHFGPFKISSEHLRKIINDHKQTMPVANESDNGMCDFIAKLGLLVFGEPNDSMDKTNWYYKPVSSTTLNTDVCRLILQLVRRYYKHDKRIDYLRPNHILLCMKKYIHDPNIFQQETTPDYKFLFSKCTTDKNTVSIKK